MTKNQLAKLGMVDLREALRVAFDAGSAHGIASHKDFRQIHAPKEDVVKILSNNIKPDASVSIPGGETGYAPRECSVIPAWVWKMDWLRKRRISPKDFWHLAEKAWDDYQKQNADLTGNRKGE